MAFDYTSIFNKYDTIEGIDFNLLMRSINLPEDLSLDIYDKEYCSVDTPWTIASYKLYNTIEYWWLLSLLNKSKIFYAPEDEYYYYVKPKYINDILNAINSEL